MPYHLLRPATTVLTGIAVALVTGAAATPGSAAVRLAAPVGPGPASAAGDTTRSILMVTGARLLVAPGAGTRVLGIVPGPSGRLAGPLRALGLGGAAYEIPQVALPYLGHGLEPSLFNVGLLLRAQAAGRLPVTVAYRGGAPSLPGVTITRAGGGTARGYLTPAGAKVSLRTSAADAAGGTITETIIGAYQAGS